MTQPRIGIAFFYHETHSFSPLLTGMERFRSEALVAGEEVIGHYENTRTEVGGFIDGLARAGHAVVPLLAAAATPSGLVTRDAYESLSADLLTRIEDAGNLDGLLIALHGSMVADGYPDPEADLLGRVRELVGWDIPIAATLDMHANVSAALVGLGVMCFGFKTYPHIDMYDQGLRAAETMTRVIQEGVTLHQAFTRVPALLPSINMRTAAGPMKDLVDASQEAERRPNIVAASVFGGFPYSDTEVAGASVVVLGTTRADVTDAATRLAEQVWARREDFLVDLPDVSEAIDIARDGRADGPIVLADIADNPLSGGSADTTALIRAVIDGGLNSVLAGAICDRDVVDQARRAGRSAELTVELGGRSSPEFGAPLCLTVEVIAVSDGCFRNSGPMNTGIDVDVEGAAWLRAGQTDFLVTGRPITANDPALFAHLGIDVTGYRYLVLKVKNHFRAAFEPIVSSIISVDAPGVAANDLTILPFRRAHRDFWPFDRQRQFAAPATEVIAVPPALPEGGA